MNWNAIKTMIMGSGLLAIIGPKVINMITTVAGCSGDDPMTKDVIEVARCTGGTLINIPEPLQAIVGGIVLSVALAGTAWFKGGTIMQNLFGKSVTVVPNGEGKPNVVTEAQVATHA